MFGFLVTRAIVKACHCRRTRKRCFWLTSLSPVILATWISLNTQVVLNASPGWLETLQNATCRRVLVVYHADINRFSVAVHHHRGACTTWWCSGHQAGSSGQPHVEQMGTRLSGWVVGQETLRDHRRWCVTGLLLIGVPYAALLGLIWALAVPAWTQRSDDRVRVPRPSAWPRPCSHSSRWRATSSPQ
jgi:hypothetical protein